MADLEQSTQVVDEHATTTSRDDKDDLSDASYLSDVEEVDHMKTGTAVDELMFDDSYFRQEKPVDVCDDAEESQLVDSAVSNPWERMADWIHCFCVVTFDLEIGQMIEVNLLMIFFCWSDLPQPYLLLFYCRKFTQVMSIFQNRTRPVFATWPFQIPILDAWYYIKLIFYATTDTEFKCSLLIGGYTVSFPNQTATGEYSHLNC
jgi:hypothetical protein